MAETSSLDWARDAMGISSEAASTPAPQASPETTPGLLGSNDPIEAWLQKHLPGKGVGQGLLNYFKNTTQQVGQSGQDFGEGNIAKGITNLTHGMGKALLPAAPEALASLGPAKVLMTLLGGAVGSGVGQAGAQIAGANSDQSQAAEDLMGLLGGGSAALIPKGAVGNLTSKAITTPGIPNLLGGVGATGGGAALLANGHPIEGAGAGLYGLKQLLSGLKEFQESKGTGRSIFSPVSLPSPATPPILSPAQAAAAAGRSFGGPQAPITTPPILSPAQAAAAAGRSFGGKNLSKTIGKIDLNSKEGVEKLLDKLFGN